MLIVLLSNSFCIVVLFGLTFEYNIKLLRAIGRMEMPLSEMFPEKTELDVVYQVQLLMEEYFRNFLAIA